MKHLTKQITKLALLLAIAMLPQLASAYDFMVDGLCYNYNSDGTSVTVTYQNNSSSSAHYTNLSGDIIIPASVSYDGNTYAVTKINYEAFSRCSGLTSVTIPNSVTTIGDFAFFNCTGLTSVTIGSSVTTIGECAFSACSGLTSLTIPNSVTTIGGFAFRICSGLTSIVVEAGNTKYDSRDNCNAIIETATNTLLYGCNNTIIPNSVTSIGEEAFRGCTGLTSVTIPNSVTSIGEDAFSGCSGLTSVTIGNSVTEIGNYAFYRCGAGLKNIIIPENVKQIGRNAFLGVDYYTTNVGDGRVESLIFRAIDCDEIGNDAFAYDDHPGYGGSPRYTVNVYDRLVFGDKVTIIPQNLPNFSFGNKNLVLPNSVKSICANSLIGTANALVLGDSIETIEAGAVTQISTVYVSQEDPVDISPGAFSNPQTLYVPVGSRAKYFMATGWDEFANIVEGEYVRANVALDIDTVQLTMGSTLQLTATVTPENASNKVVKWFSSNTSVATVTSSGYVSIVGLGEADIYACVDNSIAICHIEVPSTEVSGIIFNEGETLKLNTQRLVNLTATVLPENVENREVTWTIPDNNVLITRVNGNTVRLMAIGNGTVVITATSVENPDVNASCTIIACPGDANDDGNVTSADITALYNYLLNGDTTYLETSDINGDGSITSADVTNIYNILLGN